MELAKRGETARRCMRLIGAIASPRGPLSSRAKEPAQSAAGGDPAITALLSEEEIEALLDGNASIGDSVERTQMVASQIRALLKR